MLDDQNEIKIVVRLLYARDLYDTAFTATIAATEEQAHKIVAESFADFSGEPRQHLRKTLVESIRRVKGVLQEGHARCCWQAMLTSSTTPLPACEA